MTAPFETDGRYKEYVLRDNPFPEPATLEPMSGDPRTSGEIFNGKIFTDEIEELRKKIDSKINMVYVTGGGWERGIGKSALVYHMWKSLKTRENVIAVYLRASVNSKPSEFCTQLVGKWQIEGHLWRAFRDLLLAYKQSASPKIRPDKIDSFLESYQKMPERVHLRVFTFEHEAKVASDMQRWVQSLDDGLVPEAIYTFFETYLQSPGEFIEKLSSLRVKGKDDIDFFSTYLRLLSLTRRLYHYLFIDQFEDAVRANQGKNQLPDFCSEMRRLVVACAKRATIIVTLHPESEEILEKRGGEHLTGLAGLDVRHKVNVKEITLDEAVDLALSYLEYFRLPSKTKDQLYPFDSTAIKYIRHMKGGAPRDVLQALATTIEEGIEANYQRLDLDFLKKNHRRIFDKILVEASFKNFVTSVS